MRRNILTIPALIATLLTGCGTLPPPSASHRTQEITGSGRFADPISGCSFVLPSGRYRIEISRASASLPVDKVRHSLRIYSIKGEEAEEIARIDLYDNPAALAPDPWARRYLAYLLPGARLSHTRVGSGRLPALLIRTPRSPQAYAAVTAVVSAGRRIAVITGSRLYERKRSQIFERILRTVSL
jgi:hypothetical protein